MVIEGIGSIGRWAAALAIALAVAAPAVLSAGEGNSPSDQPVVSAPAIPRAAFTSAVSTGSPAGTVTRPASVADVPAISTGRCATR